MKLATRYQRSHLISTIVIFLLASGAFYILLYRVLLFQMDEDLEIEQHEIETYVARFNAIPQNVLQVEDQIISYEKIAASWERPAHRSVVLWDTAEQREGAFRQLVFPIKVGQEWYMTSVSKSFEATNGLTRHIGLIALSIIALLLLVSFLINRLVLRRLWKPFYDTIEKLKRFGLESSHGLHLTTVKTDEFSLLNTTLNTAANKALKDYALLKEFTENASHELQTPLAIVRSKLDLLIQDEALSEDQSKTIHAAYGALARMTRLNQSLLELAKIEGGQYLKRTVIDMKAALAEKLSAFEELFQSRNISVATNLDESSVLMNSVLADMLLNNLLTNAVHHNIDGGQMIVTLDASHLSVCNTSPRSALKQSRLFVRFAKDNKYVGGTGLGLAISKQICDTSFCDIGYQYDNQHLHCFTIQWKGARSI